MKTIKGPSGFGDAIYMRVAMEWLLKNRPDDYTILTKYPDVFYDLNIKTENFHMNVPIDYRLTYIHDKKSSFTQWQDLIANGNLPEFPFTSFLNNEQSLGYTLVIPPYNSMGGIQKALTMQPLLPEFMELIYQQKYVKFVNQHYNFKMLVQMFNSASLIISQVGWAVPLAEMLDIPLIVIFTKRALNSEHIFIRTVTPEKIVTKSTTQVKIME